ncbi:SAM-dependent methyltransferase [Nocardiopsis sediminis]|uniref:SAM-dependent methyltransferase n=1 Tax=Nocardiopsis sediminis TaxID=1778267 RepID=A0ABV8FMM5_9ACTN
MPESASAPDGHPAIDTGVPHNARIWNHWLGGTDNFPVDREMGERIRAVFPEIVDNARADREFLVRAVRYLTAEAGVRQFLDIGSGLPTRDNTHEVAQAAAPEARVVYVDNDPMVIAHARALLAGGPEGATDFVGADLRDPGRVLDAAARTLDLSRPVGLMLLGSLNFVSDDAEVRRVLDRLTGALAPGSHLVISHPTAALNPERAREVVAAWNERGTPKLTLRSPEAIAGMFQGLELLDPGVVSCSLWRPAPDRPDDAVVVDEYCGVARKP